MIIQTDMNPQIITPAPAAGKCVQMCKVHFHIYLPGQNLNVFPLKQTHILKTSERFTATDPGTRLKRFRAGKHWKRVCRKLAYERRVLNVRTGDFSIISHRKMLNTKTMFVTATFQHIWRFSRLPHLIPWTSSNKQSIIVYNFWWLMTSENFPHVSFLKRLSCR